MALNIGYSGFSSTDDTCRESRHSHRVLKLARQTVWMRAKMALKEMNKPMTQQEVAAKLGVKQSSISEWNEPGKYPEMKNALALAKLAGLNVQWLLTEEGPRRPVPSDPDAQRLWSAWPKISAADRRELAVLAEGFLQRRSETDAPEEHLRA